MSSCRSLRSCGNPGTRSATTHTDACQAFGPHLEPRATPFDENRPMRDFDYAAPTSIAEAIDILARHNGSARPMAGGTDLIDQIRVGRQQPKIVVDIKRIPELNVLELSKSGLRLGAAVPCYRIYEHAEICRQYAALADSVRIIGGIQIQSRASVGGNLCNSGPAADSTPSLVALAAVAIIAGPVGRREVPVENF